MLSALRTSPPVACLLAVALCVLGAPRYARAEVPGFAALHRLDAAAVRELAAASEGRSRLRAQVVLAKKVSQMDSLGGIGMLEDVLPASWTPELADEWVYGYGVLCEALVRVGEIERGRRACDRAGEYDDESVAPAARAVLAASRGFVLVRLGQLEQSTGAIREAVYLATAANDVVGEIYYRHNEGVTHMLNGLMDQALDRFSEVRSLMYALPPDDQLHIALTFNLGYAQNALGKHAAALDTYRSILPVIVETGQRQREFIAKTHIALSLIGLGRAREAVAELTPLLPGAVDRFTPDSVAHALLASGQAHLALGDYEAGNDALQRGLALAREHDNPVRIGQLSLALSEALVARGDYAAAAGQLDRLLALLADRPEELPRALELRAQTHAGLGEYRQALDAQRRALEAERTLRSTEYDRMLSALSVANDLDAKERELGLLRERERTAAAMAERDQVTRNAAIGVILLLALVTWLLLARFAQLRLARQQREASERLERIVEERTGEVKAEMARRIAAEQEHIALEQRLAEADKLRAIGQLTGGVAHDFNNLMTVISCTADMIRLENGDPDSEIAKMADEIMSATASGAQITGGLLAYARQQALHPAHTRLDEFLVQHEGLFRRTLGEGIELTIKVQPCAVVVDQGPLTTSMLNLLFNAREAMSDRGRVSIELTCRCDGDDCRACILVTDDGRGMSQREIARACEPFYSTKDSGNSTGLGLSMVFGFMKQSGGELNIESEPGQGTTVELMFPAVPSEAAAPGSGRETDAALAQHRGTSVMLVEDQKEIRRVSARALRRLGCEVITAADGAEAIERLRAGPRPDLLITDMIMPGDYNGEDVARFAQETYPDLPIVMTSGFAASVPDQYRFMAKPYALQTLRDEVSRILDVEGGDSPGARQDVPLSREPAA